MKKISVLLVAAAVALSASAGINFKASHATKSNKVINTELTKVKVKDLKAKGDLRLITEQPEGELKSYNRAGQGDYVSSGYIYCGQQDGTRMDIVYGEDGKVYMKNILFNCGGYFGDSWVEGTINDNVITVPMGQSIYWSDTYQANVVLAWGQTVETEDGSIGFVRDERVEEIYYVIDGQTITLQGSEGPTEIDGSDINSYLGTGLSAYWEDDDSWSGFIEWNTVLTEREPVVTPNVITEQPEGQLYTYWRQGTCIYSSWLFGIGESPLDGKMEVVFGNDGKVYIHNPLWWCDSYDSWVEGTYDWMTGIITIPTGQYLNWSEDYEYGVQLVWGSSDVYEDGTDEEGNPAYSFTYAIDDRTTEIQYMIDDDMIYLLGCSGDVNAEFPDNYIATGLMGVYSDDQSFICLEFVGEDQVAGKMVNLVPATPANPTADDWYDCGDESGYSKFYFTLPTEDVDGNIIDPECLSYSVYVDNGDGPEIFNFDAATYSYDLYEDMTEIPYWIYSGGYDFRDYLVYFYRTNEGDNPLFTENIGIQAIYTVDGEAHASDIVWLYESHVGVDELNAGKTVANVRYFNVAGQEMAQPAGMTIKVTTYTDGTTSAVKVVK